MDRSLKSYLRKQSTETLGALLRVSMAGWIDNIAADRIRIIMDLLQEREEVPYPLQPEEQEYLNQLWEAIMKGPAQ